jgi:hypothetical protein
MGRRHAVIASEAKQSSRPRSLDCFVAPFLAMTQNEPLRQPVAHFALQKIAEPLAAIAEETQHSGVHEIGE